MSDSGESRSRDVHPLYQRLLGGAVLLALAAIIIPAVFDLSHDPGRKIKETNIPPQPDGMKVEVLPLPPPDPIVVPREDIKANIEAQRPHFKVIEGQRSTVAPKPVPDEARINQPAAPVKSAPLVQKAAPVAKNTASWVVQVGSFGSAANAQGLRAKIEKAGFPVRVFADGGSGKIVNRVWAGPVDSKEKADALRRELVEKLKIKGLVLHRPSELGAK